MTENMSASEKHPLEPFLPGNATVLMLGSFPPKRERWSMDFFYPNFINDMWRIFGIVFFGDRSHFISSDGKHFDKERIVDFCSAKGIALFDSASEIIRMKDNASDKFLQIVEKTDIESLLKKIPECRAIVTTGEKATDTVCEIFGCVKPATGHWVPLPENAGNGNIRFYRMPSSSRAYPLSIDKKASVYREMFKETGVL